MVQINASFKRSGHSSGGTENFTLSYAREVLGICQLSSGSGNFLG